jgi:HK97 family phage portal protein
MSFNLPSFMFGGNAQTPQIFNEMSGMYRPTPTSVEIDRLYATSPAIKTAVDLRAENLAAVRWELVDSAGTPVASPINRVLSGSTMANTIKQCEVSMCLRGHALIVKQYGLFNGELTKLRPMNFNLYTLDKDSEEGLKGFNIVNRSNSAKPINVDYVDINDAVYMHSIDPADDFDGVSNAEVAFMYGAMNLETATTATAFFQNMAIPALLFQPAADSNMAPTPDEVDKFGALLRRIAKGVANAGRTIVQPHRWDVKELQQRFGDLAMNELNDQALQGVFMAFRVPMEMIMPSASGYAQAYEARRSWLQTWLTPTAQWYADEMTEQLLRPFTDDWYIRPNFDNVPGQKEDLAKRVEITNAKVQGGYMDLYTAQKETDTEPDENLKGLYVIGGQVVPSAQVPLMYTQAQQQAAQASAMGNSAGQPPTTGSPAPHGPKLHLSNEDMLGGAPSPTKSMSEDAEFIQKFQQYMAVYTAMKSFDESQSARATDGKIGAGSSKEPEADAEPEPVHPFATPEEYEKYWRNYDALQDDIRHGWINLYMKRAASPIIDWVKTHGDMSVVQARGILAGQHLALYEDWLGTVDKPGALFKVFLAGLAAGDEALRTDTPANPTAAKASFDISVDWNLLNTEAYDYAAQYSAELVSDIDQDIANQIRLIISGGIKNGTSHHDIADLLLPLFNDPIRASNIAQTESIGAFNAGAYTRWQSVGVTMATWRTMRDDHVCKLCNRLNGQVADTRVGWYDAKTGKTYKLYAHPRCRCFRQPKLP